MPPVPIFLFDVPVPALAGPNARSFDAVFLDGAVAPIAPGMAVTEIRVMAMAANEVAGRKAIIFGFSVRGRHPCY